jgi:hypothetical protein
MALDQMIARGVAPIDVTNTLAQVAALRQRDQSLQQDASANALMRERFDYGRQQDQAAAQQGEEDDAEWDAAYQAKDWGAMARIDPQTAKILWDQEQSTKQQAYGVQFQPGPFGSQVATDGQRFQVIEPPKPAGAGEPPKPQLVEVPLPDGTTQKQWIRPGESAGAPVGAPTTGQQLSPKDTNTARVKLTQVKVARNQLNEAKKKYAALKDTFSAGPGGQFVPSPAGKAFDAAVDSMRGSISALTRVPGVGAMSDYETRLDQSKFPTRGNYEQVGEQQLQALEQLLDTIEGGYSDLLGGKPAAKTEAPKRRKFNPQTGKIE